LSPQNYPDLAESQIAVVDWTVLRPLRLEIVLGPRFARRLRIKAQEAGRSPQGIAAILLAAALVPDAANRARLIHRELREAGRSSPLQMHYWDERSPSGGGF